MIAYVYILKCSDNTLYTGWTNDLLNRLKVHNNGSGAKYTKGRLPVKLVYYEIFSSRGDAMKREYKIKQMSRIQKEILISKGVK